MKVPPELLWPLEQYESGTTSLVPSLTHDAATSSCAAGGSPTPLPPPHRPRQPSPSGSCRFWLCAPGPSAPARPRTVRRPHGPSAPCRAGAPRPRSELAAWRWPDPASESILDLAPAGQSSSSGSGHSAQTSFTPPATVIPAGHHRRTIRVRFLHLQESMSLNHRGGGRWLPMAAKPAGFAHRGQVLEAPARRDCPEATYARSLDSSRHRTAFHETEHPFRRFLRSALGGRRNMSLDNISTAR